MESTQKDKLLSQILYKKYTQHFKWLIYNDLLRIIQAIHVRNKIFNDQEIDAPYVRSIHDKVFPLLEQIDADKILKKTQETQNEKNKNIKKTDTFENDKTELALTEKANIEFSMKTIHLFIDSYDRNKTKYPTLNPFQFPIGGAATDMETNVLTGNVSNVESVEIVRIVLPYQDADGNNIAEIYPYILLTIDEFGSTTHGTNTYLNNSFAQLTNPVLNGSFLHYTFHELGGLKHTFLPRIELIKLTFLFANMKGEALVFPSDEDDEASRITLELKVSSLHKTISSNFINRPN